MRNSGGNRGVVIEFHIVLMLALLLLLVLNEVVLALNQLRETLLTRRSTSTGETPEYEYENDKKRRESLRFQFTLALSN